MSNSFWDEYGLLHVQPNEPSENGILFASEYYALEKIHGQHIYNGENAIVSTHMYDDWYVANPPEKGEHFSHDNMTGLKCLMYNIYGTEQGTPILKWNGRFWLHPRDIIFYSALRLEGLCGFLLSLLLLPFLFVSLMRPRENTSGKCLWFLRLTTMHMSLCPWLSSVAGPMLYLSTFILSIRHGNEPWDDIFSIYFKNPNHPIRDLVREIYE
jgi:hypothetical protein